MNIQAVIVAAGRGSRMTDVEGLKPLMLLNGYPLVDRIAQTFDAHSVPVTVLGNRAVSNEWAVWGEKHRHVRVLTQADPTSIQDSVRYAISGIPTDTPIDVLWIAWGDMVGWTPDEFAPVHQWARRLLDSPKGWDLPEVILPVCISPTPYAWVQGDGSRFRTGLTQRDMDGNFPEGPLVVDCGLFGFIRPDLDRLKARLLSTRNNDLPWLQFLALNYSNTHSVPVLTQCSITVNTYEELEACEGLCL